MKAPASGPSLAQLALVLLPGGRGYLAMLAAYFDASGVTNSERHFVIGGFVAPVEKWCDFEDAWKGLLATPRYSAVLPERNGKKYAHAKRLAGWNKALREAFYAETNYLLRRTVSFAVAATFKHADRDSVWKGYPHTDKDGAYGFGFRCVLIACCKNSNEKHDNKPISFLVEHGDPGQGGAEKIFNETAGGARMIDEYRKLYNITTYGVGFKEDWGALQAADMHAYTLQKHLMSPLGPRTGKSNEYSGDINLLLSDLMHSHFVIDQKLIRDQRRVSTQNWAARKEWGQRKVFTSSSGAASA